MRQLLEKISGKFGNGSELVVYMDGSGHITTGNFSENGKIDDFEKISFQSIYELELILNR